MRANHNAVERENEFTAQHYVKYTVSGNSETHYNMHRLHLPPNEERREPEFNPKLLPSGKPEIPMRILTKLKSTVQPTIKKTPKNPRKKKTDSHSEQIINDIDDEDIEEDNDINLSDEDTYLPYYEYPDDDDAIEQAETDDEN